MKSAKAIFLPALLAAALFLPAGASAEDAPATAPVNAPVKMTARQTPIAVQFDGADSIGSRLSTNLKEIFNSSNLFANEPGDTPKFQLLISTVSEFKDRPGAGSAYSVTWVFSQKDATLKLYLDREVGVLTSDQIGDLAARIAEKTDTLAQRYGYLFPKKN